MLKKEPYENEKQQAVMKTNCGCTKGGVAATKARNRMKNTQACYENNQRWYETLGFKIQTWTKQ